MKEGCRRRRFNGNGLGGNDRARVHPLIHLHQGDPTLRIPIPDRPLDRRGTSVFG